MSIHILVFIDYSTRPHAAITEVNSGIRPHGHGHTETSRSQKIKSMVSTPLQYRPALSRHSDEVK